MSTLKKITNNISKVIIGKDESIELAAIGSYSKRAYFIRRCTGDRKNNISEKFG